MKTLLLAAAVAAILITPAVAAAGASGAWMLKVNVADMTIDVNCNLAQSGATLSGTCGRADGSEKPAQVTGTVDGSNLTFAYDVTFQDMPLHVVYKGQTQSDSMMSGTIEVAGTSGTFTGSM